MVFAPAPGVVQVEMIYSASNERVENVYHVASVTGLTDEEATAIGTTFRDWETSNGRVARSGETGLVEIVVTDLGSATGLRRVIPVVPTILGADGTQPLPNNATFAVKLGTGHRGRGAQGRVFWIGIAEDMTDGSFMARESADGIVNHLFALQSALALLTPGLSLVILHSRANKLPLNPRLYSSVADISYSDLAVDSMRTRLPFHRRKRHVATP